GIGAHIFSEPGSYCRTVLSAEVSTREATRDDVALIFGWIVELAEYERARDQVAGSPELLDEAPFGPRPTAEALIAETRNGGAPPAPAGFALFHLTFSTWEARPGIWLEDLYVPPEHRRAGVGGALLSELARITVARGYARLEWAALDWNTPALDFY